MVESFEEKDHNNDWSPTRLGNSTGGRSWRTILQKPKSKAFTDSSIIQAHNKAQSHRLTLISLALTKREKQQQYVGNICYQIKWEGHHNTIIGVYNAKPSVNLN